MSWAIYAYASIFFYGGLWPPIPYMQCYNQWGCHVNFDTCSRLLKLLLYIKIHTRPLPSVKWTFEQQRCIRPRLWSSLPHFWPNVRTKLSAHFETITGIIPQLLYVLLRSSSLCRRGHLVQVHRTWRRQMGSLGDMSQRWMDHLLEGQRVPYQQWQGRPYRWGYLKAFIGKHVWECKNISLQGFSCHATVAGRPNCWQALLVRMATGSPAGHQSVLMASQRLTRRCRLW